MPPPRRTPGGLREPCHERPPTTAHPSLVDRAGVDRGRGAASDLALWHRRRVRAVCGLSEPAGMAGRHRCRGPGLLGVSHDCADGPPVVPRLLAQSPLPVVLPRPHPHRNEEDYMKLFTKEYDERDGFENELNYDRFLCDDPVVTQQLDRSYVR